MSKHKIAADFLFAIAVMLVSICVYQLQLSYVFLNSYSSSLLLVYALDRMTIFVLLAGLCIVAGVFIRYPR